MADAFLKIRFKTSNEGGRKSPIIGDFYACPLFIDGEGFDCRLQIQGMKLELGKWYEVPVIFMNKDSVLPRLRIGKTVILWEGKDVGIGEVMKLL